MLGNTAIKSPSFPFRSVTRWFASGLGLASLLCSSLAFGQFPRDRSAREKIDEAVADHYLKMNFGQAEEQLLGVVKACEDKCRPATLARAWMYVGVVRGSGKGDQHAALEAFETALRHDPQVALDDGLATPATQATFKSAKKSARAPVSPPIGEATGDEAPDKAPTGVGLICTPGVLEVQTRRAVPFECKSDSEVVRMSLRYREHEDAEWKTLELRQSGEAFRGQLACENTMDSGQIKFFVVATDAGGDPVDTWGNKNQPLTLSVDPLTKSEPPSFPGEPAPERCAERVLCPPDFPGCVDEVTADDPDEEQAESSAVQKHWLGLHFGVDIGFIGGSDVCADGNTDFDCFDSGTEQAYPTLLADTVAGEAGEAGDAYPGTGIGSGASAGTLRALISYDYLLSPSVSLGGRVGYAFGGGPRTSDGRAFLPFHAEARVAFWLRDRSAGGVAPYLHLGGGLAQVDIKKGDVNVRDCSQEPTRSAFLDCIDAVNAYDSANQPELPEKTLDAYRKLGNGFATLGGGVLLPLGKDVGLQVNLNGMLMLPSVGLVIEPSLGFVYGL